MSKLIWVYITAKDDAEAQAIGRMLVESHLAACANIFPAVTSIYEWQGELVTDREAVLVAKTKSAMLDDLIVAVKASHSYECPCIVALPIEGGSDDYLSWLKHQTRNKQDHNAGH